MGVDGIRMPFLLTADHHVHTQETHIRCSITRFQCFLHHIAYAYKCFKGYILLNPFLHLLIRSKDITTICPFVIRNKTGIADKKKLSPTIRIKFHGKVFHLIKYRLHHKTSIFFQRPTTPIGNIFRKAMTAPTQSLSTSRPKWFEHTSLLVTINNIRRDIRHSTISLHQATTVTTSIIYFIEIEKCAKSQSVTTGSLHTIFIQRIRRRKIFFQNTAFQHPFTDSGVPSPRHYPHISIIGQLRLCHQMHIQPEQLLHLFQIICIIGGRGQYPTTRLGIPNRQQSQVFSHTADGSGRHIIFFIISQCHICIRIEHIKFHLSNVNQLLTFCMRVQSYIIFCHLYFANL